MKWGQERAGVGCVGGGGRDQLGCGGKDPKVRKMKGGRREDSWELWHVTKRDAVLPMHQLLP